MSDYSQALHELRALLGERLSTGASMLDLHASDEAYIKAVRPDAVAFPESTEEVIGIVRICAAHQCPVIPYGIGSSLEGHVIPVNGGISVDTSRMNRVLAVQDQDLLAVVQPGVTRTQLNTELRASGMMFTVDPGADATIGGMTATRASGTNAVRYGTMRENVLALEVVLADGRVIRTGGNTRKSSTGYDLTRLFVGSEGTLGIITEITVRLFGQPEAMSAASCAFETVDGAVDAVILAIQSGLPLARVELLDPVQMRGINLLNPELALPEKPHLFLELHGSDNDVVEQTGVFGEIVKEHGGSDFLWATKTEERTQLWHARHQAFYAAKALRPGCEGFVTDSCVPLSNLAAFIREAQQAIEQSGLIAPFVGHVGDGNIHLIILIEPDNPAELTAAQNLADQVSRSALKLGGTVSGEHGVGLGKKKYMLDEHGDGYAVMGALKRALDPQNLMNPGKVVSLN